MEGIRFLPLKVHNALDFIVGIALIAAPWLFGFSEVGGAAVILPVAIGAASIVLGLITDGYGFAIVRIIPVKIHLMIDFLAGVLLAVSPWLFGFADEDSNAWAPHLAVGVALIIVSLVTQTVPQRGTPAKEVA